MGGSSMNPWVFWTVTFVAGAIGAGVGTKLGQRGPLARVTRLERIAERSAEAMLGMAEAITNLYLPDELDGETKERIRVRIQNGGESKNAGE